MPITVKEDKEEKQVTKFKDLPSGKIFRFCDDEESIVRIKISNNITGCCGWVLVSGHYAGFFNSDGVHSHPEDDEEVEIIDCTLTIHN